MLIFYKQEKTLTYLTSRLTAELFLNRVLSNLERFCRIVGAKISSGFVLFARAGKVIAHKTLTCLSHSHLQLGKRL